MMAYELMNPPVASLIRVEVDFISIVHSLFSRVLPLLPPNFIAGLLLSLSPQLSLVLLCKRVTMQRIIIIKRMKHDPSTPHYLHVRHRTVVLLSSNIDILMTL